MIFNRQKNLLALLDALGRRAEDLDFQKWLFLYCMEWEDTASYDFVPYRFGPFSFTSYADMRKLISQGLLEDDEQIWIITEQGQSVAVKGSARVQMDRFARLHGTLGGDALIAESYRRFPWYATRSEIAERVLTGDQSTLDQIAELRPGPGKPGLCTIGYEGVSLEAYLNLLLRDGVSLLCDVRRNPLSRKYGFSKKTLSRACEGLGIRYVHLPELGISSESRKNLKTQQDYDELSDLYRRESLPEQTAALDRIKGWIEDGHRVALTCCEHLPEQCHRHCVAEAMERAFGDACAATHLFPTRSN